MTDLFTPPPFRPSRLYRGGHLQTMASLRAADQVVAVASKHIVPLGDGDSIVLHESVPVDGSAASADSERPASPGRAAQEDPRVLEAPWSGTSPHRSVVLFHGLSGCHGSPYMIRLASRMLALGWRVFRVDMRGCGDARALARGICHAGRSDDVGVALSFVAARCEQDDLAAIGVSLGGNQLLRYAGRIGGGMDDRPGWIARLKGVAVVAPPIDLLCCSRNMERFSRRAYNHFFIRSLLQRIGPAVAERRGFQQMLAEGKPRTLLELDERLTAPLSGFRDAQDYYSQSGSASVVAQNQIPTLVLAAEDDPIVPVECFTSAAWPSQTHLIVESTGGHAGFISRDGGSWMDDCLLAWMKQL